MSEKGLFFSKARLLLFIFVLSSFFLGQIVFAQGDGSGGSQSDPLTLVSSSITDGSTGVSLKPGIKLTFSKNIVNMSVRENNLKCFSLQSATGTSIPIDVTLADDQIDFAARNDAIITPKNYLDQGTTYSVVVSSSLLSKSGVTTGKEIRINFTTEGTKPAANSTGSTATAAQANTAAPKGGTTGPGTSTSTTTTTSKATVQPSTVPNVTNTQTKTASETSNSEQQQVASTPEKKTTESETGTKVPKSKDASKAKNKTNQTKTSHSNLSISLLVVSVLIAGMIIYFYVKKKNKIKKLLSR